jgi:hypothetical protein
MSLNPDQQCITTLLVQSEVGVESIREILGVDKRTITPRRPRRATAHQRPGRSPCRGSSPRTSDGLPRTSSRPGISSSSAMSSTRWIIRRLCSSCDTLPNSSRPKTPAAPTRARRPREYPL